MLKNKIIVCCFVLISGLVWVQCERKFSTEPEILPAAENDFCYVRFDNSIIVLGSIFRDSEHVIGEGWNPSWSPDGKYIAWTFRGNFCIYNVQNEIIEYIINDVRELYYPTWSPDSKYLVFHSSDYADRGKGTFLFNMPNNQYIKLYNGYHHIFFYPDNYRFLHQEGIYKGGGSIYISNMDQTENTLWFDINAVEQEYIRLYAHNPYTEEAFLADVDCSYYDKCISFHYSQKSSRLDTLSFIDGKTRYTRAFANYDTRYSMYTYTGYDQSKELYFLDIKNVETDKSLQHIYFGPGKHIYSQWVPPQFSPNGNFLSISERTVAQRTYSVALKILHVKSGEMFKVDNISYALVWNPNCIY